MPRIHLSAPHLGGEEQALVADAFASNWIAPLGPHVDAFEREVAARAGVAHGAALSSGTAAIHLGLELLGVGAGDEVLCPTLTFCATANPIRYLGAAPVFIDACPESWAIDPALLAAELDACAARGKLPKAVLVVDLYGQSADHDAIAAACARHGVPILEDAAEALGATYKGRPCGGFGKVGVFSFNGNKIITSSGGGMLVSDDVELVARAHFLATQARDPAPHYEHSVVGYNYRLSNVCAAIGRGQLRVLDERVAARRRIAARYAAAFADLPGVALMGEPAWGRANRWLSVITVDEARFGADREAIRLALLARDIEARPVWKPMHLQPVFAGCRARLSGIADTLFATGLCLPSSSSLTDAEQDEIIATVRGCLRS